MAINKNQNPIWLNKKAAARLRPQLFIRSCCGASFLKQFTIFDPEQFLIVDGVPAEQEDDPGKYIRVNDDLVEVNLSITPAPNLGSAMLVAFWAGDYCPIRIWLDPTKGSELTLNPGMEGTGYVYWGDLSQETFPATLYVEGRLPGDVTLYFDYNIVGWYDTVVFHVGDCVSTSDCDPDECCVNGVCKPKCISQGGDLCSCSLPGEVPCSSSNIDDPTCASCVEPHPGCEGGFCMWSIDARNKNDICQPGCSCQLHSGDFCVLAHGKVCENGICWLWPLPLPYICCKCVEPEGLVTEEQFGSRDVCGP